MFLAPNFKRIDGALIVKQLEKLVLCRLTSLQMSLKKVFSRPGPVTASPLLQPSSHTFPSCLSPPSINATQGGWITFAFEPLVLLKHRQYGPLCSCDAWRSTHKPKRKREPFFNSTIKKVVSSFLFLHNLSPRFFSFFAVKRTMIASVCIYLSPQISLILIMCWTTLTRIDYIMRLSILERFCQTERRVQGLHLLAGAVQTKTRPTDVNKFAWFCASKKDYSL